MQICTKTRNIRLITALFGLALGLNVAEAPAWSQNGSKPDGTLLFRLDLNTIIPASTTVPAGKYDVVVINGIVVDQELPFTVTRQAGQKAMEAKVAKRSGRAKARVELAPGTYLLEVAGRPEWRSQIAVTAK
jgi:hypothetical protein